MKLELMCDKPDLQGKFNVRCAHVFIPRGETALRQCKAAASLNTLYCVSHRNVMPLKKQ